ncbi:hypothetical protein RJ641_019581 [Dillenia turbinata]|uniref:MCM10 OB-fold domain-containing protein n=1 Tax=Dillenia turbinata TaxID=194707 RepID=A0AAN8UJQ6_9MAGN
MSNHQDDLDLLLSLQDRVLETPPGSPSPGFLSDDDESPRRRTRESDMSVFKDAVQDCLDYDPEAALRARKLNQSKKSNNVDVEKFSGLRLKNSVLSPEEMSNHFSDIRFVRLQTIKRRGIYCKYHKAKSSEKYSVTRTELKGGNLKTAFRDPLRSEGIYVVDPLADKPTKPLQPVKLLSVDHLKKALSNAGKVTTNAYSQGIRFLTEVTGKARPNKTCEVPKMSMRRGSALEKRPSSVSKRDLATAKTNRRPDTKKLKTEQIQTAAKQASEKMIELEWVSSDEEN